ncbi:RagB/SusD family nutrient uptake outer membrane protein [Larkinella punicea]|uniref:RagB/SusD family nutrient uptake outer membrane protein n=1 Tax=Larkinella punicea TaxID=2315727 RepID=A0A368JSS0_9BACT|nr:RagB/SusD family nutrient uptake outer membrane protein [Larkinella punicea]RCR69734.1 RagB/SusD family nutrient uptake outer membrane protein [Larkinella punicea]
MKDIVTKGTLLALALTFSTLACKDSFLVVQPTGTLTSAQLSTKNGLEGLLISAYTELNGRGFSQTASSTNWMYGSIMGGEANKGSNAGDFNAITPFQRFEMLAASGELNARWNLMYEGISRANSVLRQLKTADATVSADDVARIGAEAKFLRAHYYFELKRTFNMVPYVDETVDYAAGITEIANNTDIWPKIEADFKAAYDVLPEIQSAAGRANKWAAATYLAKTYLYQKKYAEAKTLFDLVIASGKTSSGNKYSLYPQYGLVFSADNEKNDEIVFATQNVANAGSSDAASGDLNLNWPYNTGPAGPVGCCGFFQPSFELGNSFRTDATGLPLLDGSYNTGTNQLKTDQGIASSATFTPDAGNVDPRLDHSIGRRGIPYLDWQDFPGQDWIRDQAFGGPYAPKKYIYTKAQEARIADVSNWTKGWTGINVILIRYADVLLMAAECEVEVGSLERARALVNQIRTRAANPAGYVMKGTAPAAKYVISNYTAPWTDKAAARTAVQFERKLELSGEGHRFFDLVRWGIAGPVLNAYLTYEGAKLTNGLGGAKFTPNKNEYMPLPQTQIDLQGTAILKQNPGY